MKLPRLRKLWSASTYVCFPAMLGLGWVPTLFVASTTLGYAIPYIISTSLGHVYYILPAISDSGVHTPEALVFRELINISGFLSLMNIYVRYKQYKLVLDALADYGLGCVERLNSVCFLVGVIGGLGVTFIANFKSRKAHPFAPVSEYSIHNVAAVIVFLTGLIYCILQTYISERMIGFGVNTRSIYIWRLVLTLSIVINFVVFMCGNVVSNLQYDQSHWEDHPALKLHWLPGQPGYLLHVISNAAEWLMCLSFTWFSLTFVPEFKKVRITSDFVKDTYREELLSRNTTYSQGKPSPVDLEKHGAVFSTMPAIENLEAAMEESGSTQINLLSVSNQDIEPSRIAPTEGQEISP